MTKICSYCNSTCDTEAPDESMINFLGGSAYTNEVSRCCMSSIIKIDEEDLEEIASQIEEKCFTFEEALETYGNIAYYVAENLVYLEDYQEN